MSVRTNSFLLISGMAIYSRLVRLEVDTYRLLEC
jgi:hypothetical protein